MSIDPYAARRWDSARHAYEHYARYVAAKNPPLALTFIDLVCVANFKGGSATIAESASTLPGKLEIYSLALQALAVDPALAAGPARHRSLASVPDADYPRIREAIVAFAALPEYQASDIKGFGSSFASTLLHFHFPQLVPILDRRALNGSRLLHEGDVDNQGQVTKAFEHYPALIDYCRAQLRAQPDLDLRSLDRILFIQELRSPPFPKRGDNL